MGFFRFRKKIHLSKKIISPPCASPVPVGGGGAEDSAVFLSSISVFFYVLEYNTILMGDATAA
jgi:hypothetical protein